MKQLLVILGILLGTSTHAQTTWYVDDISGMDTNSGTTVQSAFQSIDRVNLLQLQPGDSVLFRRGGRWQGNLVPKGSGRKGERIVIGAYGNGPAPEIDARGKIAPGEKASYAIRIFNQEYFEIRDLKIRNFLPFEPPRKLESRGNASFVYSPKMGIYIEGRDCGTLHDIHLVNLEICDINGDMSTKDNGGVFIEITGNEEESKRVKSRFDGLYTEGCHIHHIDRTGWSNTSIWWNRSLHSQWGDTLANGKIHNWYPSENVVLRNNRFERSGANALIVRVAQAPLVEHCLFTHNGWKGSGNASFPFNCDDALFQYNEACYTVYNSEADSWDNRKDADAGGFDSDWNCKNTVIQYNYSHHNGYGGILICCDGGSKTGFNDGTIIRYNIFEDNEHHVIRCSGTTTNSKVYNNVIFSGSDLDSVMLVYHKSWGGYSDSTAYLNNIFYTTGAGASFNLEKSTRNLFTANTFYGNIVNPPADPLASRLNPLFKGETPSTENWKTFLRFMLQDHSPAINQGVEIPGQPSEDILGKPITGKPDRGAFETDVKEASTGLYLSPVFEKAEVKKDIQFGESVGYDGKPVKLLLDVYAPAGDSRTDRPVILWMHGGGFRPGNDKSQSYIVRMANEFAHRGYVCISIDYRVRNNPGDDKTGTLNDALEDAMKGLEWIRANKESLKIDIGKVIAGGGSAGGRLATNLCYKDGDADHPWNKNGIIGLVNLWGSPDDTWTLYEVDPADPPTIIVHGTADELVPYKNSEVLVKELQKNRILHELVTLEGAPHTPSAHMDVFIPKIAAFLASLNQK